MNLTLHLTPDLEQRLSQEAERQGVPLATFTLQLLDQHLPPPARRASLVALVQSWLEGDDAEEQKETGDYLVRALDEDRLSERPLFPPEQQGITW